MQGFANTGGQGIVQAVIDVIVANRDYLSEIDWQNGDGDHGINMAKGFAMVGKQLAGGSASYAEAMDTLGFVLVSEIGGSMGPLYGNMFMDMAAAVGDADWVDTERYRDMLAAAIGAIQALGTAKPGDKTLMDTLVPAAEAFAAAVSGGAGFAEALDALDRAAEAGRDSTKDMVAKIGRAARLGERSRGVLDAGATSCCLILTTMSAAIRPRLEER